MTSFGAHKHQAATLQDQETRALVVAKEDTGISTAQVSDTQTKVEGKKINNEFCEFEFARGNNCWSVKGRL